MPQHSAARSAAGARSNAHRYAAVARALGIPSTTDDGLWRAHAPMPPGYPEAVTLAPRLAGEHRPRSASGRGRTAIVGLSNVFGPADASYRAAVGLAAEHHPGRPIVGWEPRDELAAGFAVVGALRVWGR